MRTLRLALAALAAGACPPTALAGGADLLSGETLSAHADLRLAGADGERSWTDGGFGKARFGGDRGDFRLEAVPAEIGLIWQPRLSWSTHGTLVVAAQNGQDNAIDVIEAYLSFKPLPRGPIRLSGRAGLYWPAVSLEHEGAGWSVTDMITPSAINSWIGEEVKPLAVEATAATTGSGHQFSATAGVFGFNDTAGTLLAFRGWALHDLKATAFGHQRLPRLNAFMTVAQAATTKPTIELDDRPGLYGRLTWRPPAPIAVEAFYYDNRGDPTAVNAGGQWGWRTRFLDFGARIDAGSRTSVVVQALTGRTEMGFDNGNGIWVDTRFRSAFLKLSHRREPATLSGRIEWFGTRERGTEMDRGESEDGWAATAAGSFKLSRHATLLVEAMHVESRRPSRARDAIDPDQAQIVLQAAMRLSI